MIIAVLLLAVLLCPFQAVASDGKAAFKAGIEQLNGADYEQAIESLTAAHKKLPFAGDYALFFLARAYMEDGDYKKSLRTIRKMLEEHPGSPMRQKALYMEIMNTLATGRQKRAVPLLEGYVEEFPSDSETKFLYAYMLEKTGRQEEARRFFKEIYTGAGPLSLKAHEELETEDVTLEDILDRASNLIGSFRYRDAESSLRAALSGYEGTLKKDLVEKLALSLFRQRRYPEAAELYLSIEDLYNAARSFLRADDKDAFDETLDRLLAEGDDRAAELMIVYADDKRRDGMVDEALELLAQAGSRLPALSEEALWRTGWIHYMNGDRRKALEVFTDLYDSHGSAKYLYWKAKAAEKAGMDSSRMYRGITESDYYGFLARTKTGEISTVSAEDRETCKDIKPMERADLLIEAGLEKETVAELLHASRNTAGHDGLLSIACRLKGLGRFREAMLLTGRLPREDRPDEILYPLAYWPTVKEVSAELGIDPLLLLSVIREESRFDPEAYSRAGAAGLMQLMPFTARSTAESLKLVLSGQDHLYDAETNIRLGAHHLSGLLKDFGSVSAALAAYNAGRSRVKEWLEKGGYDSYDEFIEDIPFQETRDYVKRILTTFFKYRKARYSRSSGGRELVL